MAGHSHAHNIMFKKGANDAKKAKMFTKIARDISVAAKSGTNPDLNPKLKILVAKARTLNMPKDKIATAIEKASRDTTNYEKVRYNAMFDGGISFIIEGLTDNKNRTSSDVRGVLNKFEAQLVPTGSVEFAYTHIGRIIYPMDICDMDTMITAALDAGANDVYKEDAENEDECGLYIIETSIEDMLNITANLTEALGKEPQTAEWFWKATDYIQLNNKEFIEEYKELFNALDDLDDITDVYSNADL